MANINDYIANISSAQYGDDVRDSIVGALQQCYADATGNPESVAAVIEDYRMSKDSIGAAVDSLTGIFNNYSDAGTTIQSASTSSSISAASSTWVNIGNITLSPGKWIIEYGSEFTAHATGERKIVLSESSEAPTGTTRWSGRVPGNATVSNVFRTMVNTAQTDKTLYLWAWQNSGTSLTCYPVLLAIKIKSIDNSSEAGKSLLTGISWEQGSISSTGDMLTSTARIRTSDYIDISRGRTVTFKIASGYKYDYEVYTFDKAHIIDQGSSAWYTNELTVTFSEDAYFLKLIVATTNDVTVDVTAAEKLYAHYKTLPMNTVLDQVITNTSNITDIQNHLTTDETTLTDLSTQVATNTSDIADLKNGSGALDTFREGLSLGIDSSSGLAQLYDDGTPIGDSVRIADEEGLRNLVEEWLNSHPEITTTVEDGSITEAKLASDVQSKFTDLHDDMLALNADRVDEIAVERSRIDALSSLPEGTSILDAEVMDIRLGADNVTYNSAGTAVRSQVSSLGSQITSLEDQFNALISQGTWTPHLYDYNTQIRDLGVDAGKYLRIGKFIIYHLNSNSCNFSNVSTMVQIRNFPTFEYSHVNVLGGNFYSAGISSNSGGNETVQMAGDAFYLRPNLTSSAWANAASPGWTSFMIIGYLYNV